MEHRDWASVEEFLAFVGDLFPFQTACTDSRPPLIDSIMGNGNTPLHVASDWGSLRAVELLLGAGAVVDPKGEMGVTPLGTAVRRGHARVAKLLLCSGADPHLKSKFNVSPYETVMRHGDAELQSVFAAYPGA